MFRGILIGVLSLGIAGVAFWGYQEHREKNAILINAENNYQSAFHSLTYNIDLLHDKIGTTLAMNTRKSLSPALADVWRLTSEAHSYVGQLPLTLLPFNKTEEFLANIGDFSYRTAVRDLDKEPLTDKEYENLKKLYSNSAEIQNELRKVQHLVLKNNLRWMDVEMALATGKETADNTIIDGFKTVEKTVDGYEETDLGPTNVSLEKEDNNFKHLKGKGISEQEAINIAKKYSGFKNDVAVKVTENGEGSDYGFYSVSLLDQRTKQEANMDITKKGGYPIWFIISRDIKKQTISLNEASNQALKFLKDNGFKDLELFESAQYNYTGVFNFVSKKDNVRIYPDSIKVKIALDNGNIVGLSAGNYLQSNHDRVIQKPAISLENARSDINPQVKVMENRLAVIENDINKEVLCYEFLGTLGDDTYRIFINAETGNEELVEKLKNAEPIYEDVI
ncbi:germination protein YpeB [Bacillus sp. DTU_2020_1000418_1_SI_GHA_SEK_038]|uniref:germination protein YpeB n=1 Tax=Bacillus sp. DTU_2020_1000418_1_SI_GHA_SEK_038 TaxID=3077585 RepID=UPI0028EDD002|nr:germination protein YpeB [Bacillus sp. DTU_2020_1000418_1_SI_GHA_SEK_038]WNS74052.1 germination protein YpeB [Bacillus sp. DTU_2020_1000418_1_SI_GHA_SEK_038]